MSWMQPFENSPAVRNFLAGACLVSQNAILAGAFFVVGWLSAFEAWRGWRAIRACGVKLPF